MQAIRVHQTGGPEEMKLETVPDPVAGQGQVVVRIAAVGVNPVDTYIRSGKNNYAPKTLPYTPGIDAAGTVESVGPGVHKFKPTDRVYLSGTISGAYAQKALCNEAQLQPLPENASFEQGAAVNVPYVTAYHALFVRGEAVNGQTVLIHGASGGVGTAAVQWAVSAGLHVVGTAGTEAGLALVKQLGAHEVLNHHDPNHVKNALSLTGGKGYDVIIEMLANVNLNNDLTLIGRCGRVVIVGSRGRIEIDPRQVMTKGSSIVGTSLLNASDSEMLAIHTAIFTALSTGAIRPIIRTTMPLSQAAQAHRLVMEPGAAGNIILLP